MRKLAIAFVVAALLITGSHRRAEAACHLGPCPTWLDAMAYMFAAGVVGGYTVGTGEFIYRDMTQPEQTLNYGVLEMSANSLLATMFVAGTIDTARNGSGTVVVWGSLAALHTTLAVHGVWRISRERSDLRFPQQLPVAWIGGSLYGLNTLFWVAGTGSEHERPYAITEIAVNAPIAAGLGYLAYDRFSSYRGGPGLLYGGMAAVSTLLVVHGIRTAIHPHKTDSLDLLGTDIMPTVVDDGHEMGPGLGLSRTW